MRNKSESLTLQNSHISI